MKKMPAHLSAYKKTKTFDQDSIPKGLLNEHTTKEMVWGKIIILEGELLYIITETGNEYKLNMNKFGIVEPEIKHRIAPLGKVKFYVEFYK